MSDTPRRMIEIGTLPSGYDSMFIAEGGADPLAVMIREGNARLDTEREAEERKRAAQAVDIERARDTRRARAARRFRSALKMFRRS